MRRTVSLVAAAIVSACCLDYWGEVEEHTPLSDLRLEDVEYVGYRPKKPIAFGSQGLVVLDGERVDLGTTVDLHGIANVNWNGEWAAITGGMGTIVVYHEEFEGPTSWAVYQAQTDAALVAAAFRESTLVAVGDEVVVTLDVETESIEVIAPPEGGWGSLHTVVMTDLYADGRLFLAGDAGVAWVIAEGSAIESARRIDLGGEGDVRAGGYHVDDGHYWLVGEDGLALREHATDDWRRVDAGTSADFVDFAVGAALTSEGELWDPAHQRRIAEVPWARGIGEGSFDYDSHDEDAHEDPDVLIVGDSGRFAILEGC